MDENNPNPNPEVKMYTEEEIQRRVTAEVDRRVESGIQKGLETQRQKWEKEFADRAKMTAEELAKKDLEEKTQTLTAKEVEIKRRANLIDAKEMLSEAQIPKSQYDEFVSILVSDDEAATKANVENFIKMYNKTKTEIETKVKTELSKVPAPKSDTDPGTVTKAQFDKMTYQQKVDFKAKNPELYKKFIS